MDIGQRIDTARIGLQSAIEKYAKLRMGVEGCGHLPGHFLDSDGANNGQHGLTALPIWQQLSRMSDDANVTSVTERCSAAIRRIRDPKQTVKNDWMSDAQIRWEHMELDYQKIIVKRCLCIYSCGSKEEAVSEIRILLNFAFGEGEGNFNYMGFSGEIKNGQYNQIISTYVMMAILNCSQLHQIDKECIGEEYAKKIEIVVNNLKKYAQNLRHNSTNNFYVMKLYILNCIYRFETSELYPAKAADTRNNIMRTLRDIYYISKKDPLKIGTDITIYYRTSDQKDRYFRFNSDVVMAESFLISFRDNPKCFDKEFGRELFERIIDGYYKDDFSVDPSGQRITIYSIFHVFNLVNRIHDNINNSNNIWLLYTRIFNLKEFVKALTTTIILLFFAIFVFGAGKFFEFDALKDFSKIALLTSTLPVGEYAVARVLDRLL